MNRQEIMRVGRIVNRVLDQSPEMARCREVDDHEHAICSHYGLSYAQDMETMWETATDTVIARVAKKLDLPANEVYRAWEDWSYSYGPR